MLIVMAGLPGSGKSTLAAALAPPLRAAVMDKDEVRAALFPPELVEYSREQDDLVVRLMLQAIEYSLAKEPGLKLILDGRPFSRRYQLDEVIEFAQRIGVSCRVIQCICSDETAERRLREAALSHPAANRDVELYRQVRDGFEPITVPTIVVDTDRPLEECVAGCLRKLATEL